MQSPFALEAAKSSDSAIVLEEQVDCIMIEATPPTEPIPSHKSSRTLKSWMSLHRWVSPHPNSVVFWFHILSILIPSVLLCSVLLCSALFCFIPLFDTWPLAQCVGVFVFHCKTAQCVVGASHTCSNMSTLMLGDTCGIPALIMSPMRMCPPNVA